jgi:hypothetical protein
MFHLAERSIGNTHPELTSKKTKFSHLQRLHVLEMLPMAELALCLRVALPLHLPVGDCSWVGPRPRLFVTRPNQLRALYVPVSELIRGRVSESKARNHS